jgi:hypothetical protein
METVVIKKKLKKLITRKLMEFIASLCLQKSYKCNSLDRELNSNVNATSAEQKKTFFPHIGWSKMSKPSVKEYLVQ